MRATEYLLAIEDIPYFNEIDCDRSCPLLMRHGHLRCRFCREQYACNLIDFQPVTAMRIAVHGAWHRRDQPDSA